MSKKDSLNRGKLLDNELYKQDGNASKRVAEFINNILKKD